MSKRGNTTYKYYHEHLVMLALSEAEHPLQRKEIMATTGMKRTTVYDTLQRLAQKNQIIIFNKYVDKQKGRPPTLYQEKARRK